MEWPKKINRIAKKNRIIKKKWKIAARNAASVRPYKNSVKLGKKTKHGHTNAVVMATTAQTTNSPDVQWHW